MTDLERSKWPDDVKRLKDEYDMHAALGQRGFMAISLADGSCLNHAVYPTWNEAVRSAKWDRDNYMFPEATPDGITYKAAAAILNYGRTLSKMGYRIPSPDWEAGPMVSSMPVQPHDRKRMIRQLIKGKPLYPEDVPYGNLPSIRKMN